MRGVLEKSGVRLDPRLYLLTRSGVEVSLSPMQFRLLEMVANEPAGVTPETLFERLYVGMDSPLQGRRSVHMQRCHANHKLAAIKVRITSNRSHGGPGSFYRLEVA